MKHLTGILAALALLLPLPPASAEVQPFSKIRGLKITRPDKQFAAQTYRRRATLCVGINAYITYRGVDWRLPQARSGGPLPSAQRRPCTRSRATGEAESG